MRIAWAIMTGAAMAAGTACAVADEGAGGRVPPDAAAPQSQGEVRDVILMLPSGPLHLRFYISLGGQPLPDLRRQYVDRLIAALDADQDGKLTRQEADRSPLLRKPQRASARQFLQRLGADRSEVTRRDIEQSVERVGGETVAYRQDLASAQNDRMLFEFLDEDASGVLELTEIKSATERILNMDNDDDECVSFQELLPEPEEEEEENTDPANPLADDDEPPVRLTATISKMMRDTRETLLPLRVIQSYDRNRDRKLSRRELRWTDQQFSFLDTSGDGLLDEDELAFIHQTPVDVELAIDLEPPDSATPAMQVLSLTGRQVEVTPRPDFVKIRFADAVFSFSRRFLDPLAAAQENAMIEFNNMDADGNGYLDRMETRERVRFVRGLFEAIDFDGDGKIFGEEMEQYVRVRAEPAATTCRVNMYDAGRGFFVAIDSNGDGRIGVRERLQSARSLAMMERDGRMGIAAREPIPHFHVEFVRGSYQLFGASNEFAALTPAFQQRALSGPVWFQRMDRNGDGDVSWREFIAPRDIFHQLDRDNDGLIDPQEAAWAATLFPEQEESVTHE